VGRTNRGDHSMKAPQTWNIFVSINEKDTGFFSE